MPISMSTHAHYVTQSSVYSCHILGPLTDRRITQLYKEKHPVAVKAKKKRSKQLTADQLLTKLLA